MREEDLSYFDSKEFRKALRTYMKALKEDVPVYMDADDLTDIAEYFMMTGQEEEAAKAICTAIRLHPDSTAPRVFLARQNMFTGNLDEAKAICEAIPDQDDREVVFLRGELILREQGAEKADNYLIQEARNIAEDRDLYYSDCAEIFIDYTEWETADKWLKRLHSEFPSYRKTDSLQIEVLIGMGQHKRALPLLKKHLDKSPFDENLWAMQGDAYFGMGDFKKALDSCENALAIDADNEKAMAIKGNCLFQEGNYEDAIPLYERLVKMNPNNDIYHYIHSVCLTQMQRYEEAAMALDNSARTIKDPTSINLAYVYLHQVVLEVQNKNFEKALKAVEKLKDFPSVVDTVEYHVLKGHVMLAMGDNKEAMNMFDIAMCKTTNVRDTFTRIGICFLQVGNLPMAEKFLRHILETTDENEFCPHLATLAYIYWGLDDFDNCLKILKRCDSRHYELLRDLFEEEFPGVVPAEYYMYIYKQTYGKFPKD